MNMTVDSFLPCAIAIGKKGLSWYMRKLNKTKEALEQSPGEHSS